MLLLHQSRNFPSLHIRRVYKIIAFTHVASPETLGASVSWHSRACSRKLPSRHPPGAGLRKETPNGYSCREGSPVKHSTQLNCRRRCSKGNILEARNNTAPLGPTLRACPG